ncbi:MAG: sulfite exporter TauE/SafE family protein [Magnetococcales bacterium]|nr:sulfite exporter TauE/SafE family protein [Magnetococcales bacterium]
MNTILLLGAVGTGLFAGILAGLFGVGGGIIIVPALLALFHVTGVETPYAMQLAVGTSLATIIITNISSTWHHHRRGSVVWQRAGLYLPGVLAGAGAGGFLATLIAGETLKALFGGFEIIIGLKMAGVPLLPFRRRQEKKQPPTPRPATPLPWLGQLLLAVVIGAISSLFGIGGGTLTVPALTLLSALPMKNAVATSSAIGVGIAVAGALSFLLAGQEMSDLPASSWGFVLPTAFVGIIIGTLTTTPLGVRLAHALPHALMKRLFGILMIVVGIKLLIPS